MLAIFSKPALAGRKAAGAFLIGCLTVLVPCTVSAQNAVSGVIKGFVKDARDGKVIPGAIIDLENRTTGARWATRSNRDGSYIRPNLSPGEYLVQCLHSAYQSDSYGPVHINLNHVTTLEIPPFLLLKKEEAPGRAGEDGLVPSDFLAAAAPEIPHAYLSSREQTAFLVGGPMDSRTDSLDWPEAQTPTAQPAPAAPAGGATPARDARAVRMVNTENGMRGGNFPARFLEALPLPGIRSYDSLAFLVAGVADPPQPLGDSTGPGIGAGVGTSGQFAVNGMRSRANSFTVDGSDDNDQDVAVRRQGYLSLLSQPVETVEEFQISTLLWDAEQGRNMGSQVNAVSRSGGKKVHGELYGYYTDSRWNARNFFDTTGGAGQGKDLFRRAQAGATLAGPLWRQTRFFAGFEQQKIRASREKHFAVPTAEERIFQGLPKFKVITSPYSINNTVDFETDSGTTPLGASLMSLYPSPNQASGLFGPNGYANVLPADGKGQIFSLKISHQVEKKHNLDARYSLVQDFRVLPEVGNAIQSTIDSRSRSQNLALILDSVLSSSFLNQARISYGRTRLQFPEHHGFPLSLVGDEHLVSSRILPIFKDTGKPSPLWSEVFATTGPIGQIVVRPYSPIGIDPALFPQMRVNNTFQFADTLTRSWTRNSLKVGGDVRWVQFNSAQERYYLPFVEINPGFLNTRSRSTSAPPSSRYLSGGQFASLGQISSIFQTISTDPTRSYFGLRFAELNFYANDSWHPVPTLSLEFGVRYERNTVPHEVHGRLEEAMSLNNLPVPGSSAFDRKASTEAFQLAVTAYRKILGSRSGIYEADNTNWGPHLGFSWDPNGKGRTALRGGFGLYYDTILGSIVSQSRNVFPMEIPFLSDSQMFGMDGLVASNPAVFNISDTEGNLLDYFIPGTNRLNGSPSDFVALVGNLFYSVRGTGGLTFTLPEMRLRTPYVQQWHLTLEREVFGDFLLSAGYVGSKGTRLLHLTTPNGGPSITPQQTLTLTGDSLPTVSFDSTRYPVQLPIARKESNLGAYRTFESSGSSSYHAMQIEARKRYSYGFIITAAYNWSHSIDDASDIFESAGAKPIAQDSGNLRAERGLSGFDTRHQFRFSAVWSLPSIFQSGASPRARALFRNWQLASIFHWRSGQPYTLEVPIDANMDGNLTDRPAGTRGLRFYSGHGVQRISLEPGYAVDDFFILGKNGLVGRNTQTGDGLVNLDLALSRRCHFRENRHLEVRVEIFNFFNRANFGLPVRIIGNPGFGLSQNTLTSARLIQLALKINF